MAESIDKAKQEGLAAAKAGKSQNDNPYNDRPFSYEAIAWNHAFCHEAFGTEVFD